MKTLHLTLKKKWFDMILSGEKQEEYREIKKYWAKRLVSHIEQYNSANCRLGIGYQTIFKDFDKIIFKNGYSKDCPVMEIECRGTEIGYGLIHWGAEKNKEYFVIKLGMIYKQSRCNSTVAGAHCRDGLAHALH